MTPDDIDRLLQSYQRERVCTEIDADYVVVDIENAANALEDAMIKRNGIELLSARYDRIQKARNRISDLIGMLSLQEAAE